ncbi:hypothetical protein HPULCUR_007264 [Helicostylum pulchrum]|uniref:Uncharacterized protein n=1 Tax=Helicostylum pulchrum TaxID=562976 RepID=A0ABP9Y490_9FUNG
MYSVIKSKFKINIFIDKKRVTRPSFFKRHWLCPNHKHDRMDNVLEIMVGLMIVGLIRRTQNTAVFVTNRTYSNSIA